MVANADHNGIGAEEIFNPASDSDVDEEEGK